MKKLIYLQFLLISLAACSVREATCLKKYEYIENEVNYYRKLISYKVNDYHISNKKLDQRNISENLYSKILHVYYESNYYINTIKTNSIDSINFEPFLEYLKERDCGNQYLEIDTKEILDTLYVHNLKFNYIKCIIKNSQYYDSMPELKARIESYDE